MISTALLYTNDHRREEKDREKEVKEKEGEKEIGGTKIGRERERLCGLIRLVKIQIIYLR